MNRLCNADFFIDLTDQPDNLGQAGRSIESPLHPALEQRLITRTVFHLAAEKGSVVFSKSVGEKLIISRISNMPTRPRYPVLWQWEQPSPN